MQVQSFDDFGDGLDVRKPKNLDNPQSLRTLVNAYVTQGQTLRRRPGLKLVGEMRTGGANTEHGLCAHNGRLHTFSTTGYGNDVIGAGTDDEVEVWTHKVSYNDAKASAKARPTPAISQGQTKADPVPEYVNFSGGFNNGHYVSLKFDNDKSLHYYLDGNAPVSTAKAPIPDSKCPHSAMVTIAQSKVYAANGVTVRFSATANADDGSGVTWDGDSGDAGFLPTGDRSPGNSETTGLGVINNRLVVFHEDAAQIWAVDPDPQRNELEEQVAGVGTRYYQSIVGANKDLYFLSDVGVRSIGGQSLYRNMRGSDVGSPIDSLLQTHIREHEGRVDGQFFPGGGQYFLIVGDDTYVLTKSKQDKLNAWSVYKFAVPFRQMAHMGDRLYIRNGNKIYVLDEETVTDGDEEFNIEIETPFYSFGQEGQFKMFKSMEAIVEGVAIIDHCVNPNNNDDRTAQFQILGDTRTVPTLPLGILAPALSCKITGTGADFKSLNSLIYRYDLTAGGI